MLKQALLLSVVLLTQSQLFAQTRTTTKPAAAKVPVKANAAQPVRLSQFERAMESDLLIDQNNNLHVVFQESADFGKPVFIYYTMSSNNGASWTKPVTLSNDETGNGGGPPSLIQDGNGVIYAIWKRYGLKGSKYASPDVSLDGRGGYVSGTLFYKVLQGGQWSQQYQISEETGSQFSWFPFVNSKGQLYVCWNEVSPESVINNWITWYYADWVRFGILTPTGVTARAEIAKPALPKYKSGPPPENGVLNLHGYADKDGNVHYIYTKKDEDKFQKIFYYDGKKHEAVYTYPMYQEGNNFMNPPRLLYDDKGVDHVIFVPSSSTLESEQLWDLTPVNKQRNVLASIQQKGTKIYNFQANQGAGGRMSALLHVGGIIDSKEAYGFFYDAGKWDKRGLTKNAGKNNFIYAELTPLTYLTTLTTYSSQHGSVAYTKDGKKKMTMTLAARWSTGSYSLNNPSIIFMNLD